MHASHEALTFHSPVAHPGSPWLTLLARCEGLKRHGGGEREGELGADFSSIVPLGNNVASALSARQSESQVTGSPRAHPKDHPGSLQLTDESFFLHCAGPP